MEVHLILFLNLLCFGSFPQVISNGRRAKSLPAVDALITSLEDDRWRPDDEACLRDTLEMLRGVKNNTLWATWVWDSMQPPVGTFYGQRFHLGNYDHPGLSGKTKGFRHSTASLMPPAMLRRKSRRWKRWKVRKNIIVLNMSLASCGMASPFLQRPTKDRYFNELSFGVCLPAICRPSSVDRIFRHMHQLTYLPDGDIYVDSRDCQKAGEEIGYSRGFFTFWSVVGMLLSISVISTLFNKDGIEHTLLNLITNAFCMKRNFRSLIKEQRDEIRVMNGIRVLSATLVIGVHEVFYTIIFHFPVVNGLVIDKMFRTTIGLVVLHLDLIVDTFFTLSGLLLIRNQILGKKNFLFVIVKRYIRLIGPFALCILYITTATMSMGHGPLWKRMNRCETDVCANSWWKNLLMINTDVETICHVVGYYISCDFQLAILGSFLFCLFRKNRKLGVTAFATVTVGLNLNLGWLIYSKNLNILPFSLMNISMFRSSTELNITYMSSHSRAGAYSVGMAMGYIVATYKPGDHRNVINKVWSNVIAVASLATMSTMLSIGAIFAGRPYDPLEAAAVVTTNRVAWAVAVCCLIGVCEYGSVSLITDLLSWPGFVPLSKLSYGLYLLHPFIIQRQKYSTRSPVTFEIYNSVVNSLGVLFIVCVASLIMYLILEKPLINISNGLFTERILSLEQNGKKKVTNRNDNGVIPQQNKHIEHTKAKTS